MEKKIKKLKSDYERTLNNCKFYESENNTSALLNEIGVLRGLAYALETFSCLPCDKDFCHFIEIQQQLKNGREYEALAKKIYEASLDMDYADYEDTRDDETECIRQALVKLKEINDSPSVALLHALEMAFMEV